ncbi:vacuolar protein sorting-associated protein 35 [Cucurbitaria berberidis CBS 394.84]|uniref:Vacuolar protein sorting-associated protein 35 n=1 Tax=Cucurbitaria berberidis CBS 394.84 TaxID=1168544 RepID=A0A9P4GB91_9PLEO|nr:vacuolar protein sorting-associated protein 35 [Cucurbitaria berberidis CBS 394.84]KAF1842432.1 vacuolar protein sorting-associated protein 35 [Cucurbitaria berberidis CBS 394.84]
MASSPPPVEDQARLLEDALAVVRQQTMLMRRCLETPGKLMDALKNSSTLVSELRTSSLGPKQYYELYMAVFDALRHLSVYLRENHPVNHLADLYELVQYAGNIIPRLYLMVTVGTVYMAIEDAPVKEIMKDMMEMSRGVQHPIRGLFLRYYLAGQARDCLPSGDGEGPEGNLQDSISFILTNFVEMNKLWVRLQHQGHSREREQRTKERQELQLLVGSNLVRLSQLVDLENYKKILNPLLEQIVQCRDVLAQEYLLEVVTQVFPDEFHLHTLDQFLSAVARLNPHVNVKAIVVGLMDRLSSYAQREAETESPEQRKKTEEESIEQLLEKMRIAKDKKAAEPEPAPAPAQNGDAAETEPGAEEDSASSTTAVSTADTETTETTETDGAIEKRRGIPNNVKLFEIFHEQVQTLVKMQRLPIQDTIGLLVSLANLALNIYPERLDYIDQVLTFANQKVAEYQNSADLHSQATQSQILNLLLSPIKTYVSLFTALALPNFIPLLHSQPYPTRRAVAGEIARSLMRNQTYITSVENLESVLEILKVLIREGIQQATGYPGGPIQRRAQETDETIEEQGWLARIVHLIRGKDNDTQFKLLQAARKSFAEGNERVKYTSPAIITASLKLARQYKKREHFEDNWQSQSSALYKFMHNTLSTLYTRVTGSADLALRLFIACGQVADQNNFEEVAYEYFAQAFTIYEEAISDSRAQFQAVCVIASGLHTTRHFGKENYDTLITKCALHGSKLLKKPDQCRAVYLASHLWWATEIRALGDEDPKTLYRDGKRVLECLQRALRVADACMDAAVSVELFVEILNRYVYYFDQENDAVTTKYLNGLIELIHSNLQSNENASSLENPRKHFQRTLDYITSREYEGVVTAAK